MAREVTIAVIQQGPNSPDKAKNIEAAKKAIDEANKGERADFIVFPELATTQFFAVGLGDEDYFKQAETLPGPATKALGEKAKQYQNHILMGIFEKGEAEGEHYNSEVVIGPNGNIIKGTRDDGTVFPAARKNYLGSIKVGTKHTDEKLYFKPGPGHILFETKLAKIGIVICYDRWFAESYRCLSLMGAEIIFVAGIFDIVVECFHDVTSCALQKKDHYISPEIFFKILRGNTGKIGSDFSLLAAD